MSQHLSEQQIIRREKLASLQNLGIDPYPAALYPVNILASAIATGLLIRIFGEAGLLYATAGMTVIIFVFAEVLPKTIAFKSPNNIALFLAPFINILVKLFLGN